MTEDRVWVEDTDWSLPADAAAHRCRGSQGGKGCGKTPVACLMRSTRKGPMPYYYCADHLSGRRVEDGKVLVAVHPDSPSAALVESSR